MIGYIDEALLEIMPTRYTPIKNPCGEIPLGESKLCNMYEPPMDVDNWLDFSRHVYKVQLKNPSWKPHLWRMSYGRD